MRVVGMEHKPTKKVETPKLDKVVEEITENTEKVEDKVVEEITENKKSSKK